MAYQVMARRLRPSSFKELVGQNHAVKALTHALNTERVHHAYLFTGTRGVGKTTIARILAKCLNCETGVTAEPCGTCGICKEVDEGRFIDLIEVDAASRTGVDNTRDLLDNAQYLPSRGRYKVYLIDEVHMLSIQSFNALLKTLEEPPEHVKFLLATTDPKKVPMTVLSRCLQFQLKNLLPSQISQYLDKVLSDEGIKFDQDALSMIATAAAGSMRDALSITDQAIGFGEGVISADAVQLMLGNVGRDSMATLLKAIKVGDAKALLALTAELGEKAVDFEHLLAEFISSMHRTAVDQALGQNETGFSEEAVQLFYQIALMGSRDLPYAPDPQSGFEMTMLRILSFTPSDKTDTVPPLGKGSPDLATDKGCGTDKDLAMEKDLATDKTEAKSERSPKPEGETSWYETVEQLDLRGVTKMILENCALVSQSAQNITLCLDRRHDMLLNTKQKDEIQRSLSEHFGRLLKLDIRLGVPEFETTAERNTRLKEEGLRKATLAMESDKTVQALIETFSGRLDGVQVLEGK